MMPRQQNVRDRAALPFGGAGVLRVFEQAVVVAFFLKAHVLRQHAGDHAGDAVDQHERGQLAAGEHIVADRDLLVHKRVEHPLVHPFIMPAQHTKIRLFGQLLRFLLGQHRALRRHIHKIRPLPRLLAHRAKAVGDRLGVHHHAAPAAIRIVVGLFLLVERVVADLVTMHLDHAFILRPPENAFAEHPLAHLGEQRHHVNPHRQTTP